MSCTVVRKALTTIALDDMEDGDLIEVTAWPDWPHLVGTIMQRCGDKLQPVGEPGGKELHWFDGVLAPKVRGLLVLPGDMILVGEWQ